jgi:hypothetical protein
MIFKILSLLACGLTVYIIAILVFIMGTFISRRCYVQKRAPARIVQPAVEIITTITEPPCIKIVVQPWLIETDSDQFFFDDEL